MELTIHRGAQEVGGSCVEISSGSSMIIIDAGLPLSFMDGDNKEDCLPQPLFDNLSTGKTKPDAVFLSHAHLDHYGLVSFLPTDIPVYSGKTTRKLMDLSSLLSAEKQSLQEFTYFQPEQEIKISEFTLVPYLMDHSAMDAYGFMVKAEGKTLFYTGDFRGHGRKKQLFENMLTEPPDIDVLLMEGTMVGPRSDEGFVTESELEESFLEAMQKCEGTVFVTASSQNIDRLVTIFKATRRAKRKFIVDLYTAEVLDSLTDYPRLPKTSWLPIRVAFSGAIAKRLEENGHEDIVQKHRENGIKWTRIQERPHEFVVLCRPSVLGPIKKHLDIKNSAWIYSMWRGYFERSPSLKRMKSHFNDNGVEYQYIHTSGHARLGDLKRLVEAVKPATVIPIHTFHPELFEDYFGKVKMVEDGVKVTV